MKKTFVGWPDVIATTLQGVLVRCVATHAGQAFPMSGLNSRYKNDGNFKIPLKISCRRQVVSRRSAKPDSPVRFRSAGLDEKGESTWDEHSSPVTHTAR